MSVYSHLITPSLPLAVFRLGKNVLAYDYKLITTEFVYHKIKQCFVDRGYQGHGIKDIQVFISRQKRGVANSIKRLLKRRKRHRA
ncbi:MULTISPECIES: hypothetical protein [sulfur-oxidizing symbionts]|uniref:hypothetical protein n=1 Tax=sulfur-oxidizing symbionts TaxID=32036 RepID=UPI00192BB5A1|nr:hypothetical protein [Bathymodiolus azoricus thioautotrophic gill symbiont]